MKFLELFGWYGMIAIIGAYALVSFSLMQSDSVYYQLLNLTGATGVAIISFSKKAYQPAALNLIWTIIAALALAKLFL